MFNTEEVALRLQVTGLNRPSALAVARLVQKWITCSGEAWTIKRLKSMKVDLLHRFAGLQPLKKDLWIRYVQGGPKGPFGPVFRSPDFRISWNAIMVYTALVYDDDELLVTDEQWNDLKAAIQREPVDPEPLVRGLALVHETPLKPPIQAVAPTGARLVDFHASPKRRGPITMIGWDSSHGTAPEEETVLDSLKVLPNRVVHAVMNNDILSGTVEGLEELIATELEINWRDELRGGPPDLSERPEMGVVSLLQEGGYKLRFIANPYRVWQAALQPLGDVLFRGLRAVPNDCTFDHERGVTMIQQWLADGLPARSTDLSNATDRAPLAFQLEYLSRLGIPTRWLQFLESCCRGDWRVTRYKKTKRWETIRWTVGSPLGLYPTFPAFALWHHAIVQAAFARLRKPKVNGVYPYVILGDDRVIMDDEVDDLVNQWMTSWGMKISAHKSLASATVAEFAGRVITSQDVYRGFKWKGPVSDESFVDFASMFGPRSLLLMRPRHRRVLAYIADLPEPFGLGWNPFGIGLEERFPPSLERVFRGDERMRTFTRRSARMSRLLYMSSFARASAKYRQYARYDALSSDQEESMVLKAMLPGLEALGEALWPNLEQVALVRGVPPEVEEGYRRLLRAHSVLEKRSDVSTLEVYERKIRKVLRASRRSRPSMKDGRKAQ